MNQENSNKNLTSTSAQSLVAGILCVFILRANYYGVLFDFLPVCIVFRSPATFLQPRKIESDEGCEVLKFSEKYIFLLY